MPMKRIAARRRIASTRVADARRAGRMTIRANSERFQGVCVAEDGEPFLTLIELRECPMAHTRNPDLTAGIHARMTLRPFQHYNVTFELSALSL